MIQLSPVTFKRAFTAFCKHSMLILCVTIFPLILSAQLPASANEVKMQQLNSQAVQLINIRQFKESIPLIEQAIALKPNATSYYYLCHVNAVQNDWDEAIKAGEKTIELDPTLLAVYPDLCYCYTKLGMWKKAEAISEQVRKASPNGANDQMLNDLATSAENDSFSKVLIALFFILLGGAFFLPVYAKKQENELLNKPIRFSELFLVSGAVSCLFWILFFAMSHWIWSKNPYTPYAELTPSIGMFSVEHDGIEAFVMYLLMFGNVTLTLFLTAFLLRMRANRSVYIGIFSVSLLLCMYYFYSLGFIPAMMEIGEDGKSKLPLILFVLAFMSIGLYLLYQKFSLITKLIIVGLLAYTCLVMIVPSVLVDMSFMLYPAIRMMKGVKIPDIYFQYDLFLSFVAYLWLKLNLSVDAFPYIGQIAYFLFFTAMLFFTDQFFKTKGLSVVFIIGYVIVRYYAIWEPGAGIIQVTPIRLDLWAIPLIVAYRKGINHWLVGICVGLLVLFHRNLGVIYLGAYAELLIVLFVADVFSLIEQKTFRAVVVSQIFMKHLKANIINIGIIILSIALCFILFGQMFSQAAITYRKIGVGMIRISKISFYWYVPLVLSCLTVLLLRFKNMLGDRYSTTGLFIVLIAIGESMYFFGRSHENGILNVSAILVLALFVVFDILITQAPAPTPIEDASKTASKGKKEALTGPAKSSFFTEHNIYLSVPFLFVLFSGYYYSGRLSNKIDVQYNNFKEGQYICPIMPMPMDTTAIRHITHNSPNVFFLDFDTDFYYYYYGHYTPLGYFNPCEAWIYRKDLIKFMQDLIDKHYYVVYNYRKYGPFNDYIPYLKYNQLNKVNDMVAVTKTDAPMLLPESPSSLFHIAVKDSIANTGMDFAEINAKKDITIEVICKPTGPQTVNSSILNNLNRLNSLTGITLQSSGAPGQYVFAYGSGQGMPSVSFGMEDNKWHYLAITMSKDAVKVFDNGKQVATINSPAPMIFGDMPLSIGNRGTKDGTFNGQIKEVKLSDGATADADIAANSAKLEGQMNALK